MKTKCDLCDNEASVHEVVVKNGKREERHLCEKHARETGVIVQGQTHASVGEFYTKFVISQSGLGAEKASRAGQCSECGLTFSAFRQTGLLGCPDCYTAFESRLEPLISRAHEGGEHHNGKVPLRCGSALDRQKRLVTLRKQLSDAIKAEQYERAAALRDQLMEAEGVEGETQHSAEDEGER